MSAVLGSAARRMVDAGREYLPRGQLLPEDAWRRRHRTLSILLRAHVLGLFCFALIRGYGPLHAFSEAAIIAGSPCWPGPARPIAGSARPCAPWGW